MRRQRTVSAILTIGLLVLPVGLQAQSTGSIEGRVTREDGTGIGGVTVEIDSLGEATLTDERGGYRLTGIPAGTYELSFSLGDNFATLDGVEVIAGKSSDVGLKVDWEVAFAETITVTSASRRAERIVEAPAAVTLVGEQQIEREAAYGQVPKLLEFTPGAEVTQSGLYDYNVNTRGFNSSLNRRVATLIDGRDPSVPFLGAQEWAAISFPLDDFASVELVRGPSAALYGANASSGVLNMVTKRPRNSEGGLVRLTAGELSTTNGDFRWAGSLGAGWYVKLLGGIRDHDDWYQSRNESVEYPGLPMEAVPLARDKDEISFYGLRFDKYVDQQSFFTLEGGTAKVEGPVFQTGIGRVQLVDVERPWVRFNYFHPRWNFLGTYNKRDAPEQLALASGNNLTLDTSNLAFELQTNWELGETARVVAGVSYSEDDIDSFDPKQGAQTLVFEPITADFRAVFAQLDWNLAEDLRLVLAGRYDESDLHDSQFSPKGALVWSVNSKNTLRLTYNEAFQVANYSELFLDVNLGAFPGAVFEGFVCLPALGKPCGFPAQVPVKAVGNRSLDVEEISTLELGYNGILGPRTLLTLDVYTSRAKNFITDLLPQLGTPAGRINPNFGPFAGVPAPVAAALDGVAQMFIPGAPGAAVTNNVDGSPIIVAVSYTNFGDVDTNGADLAVTTQFARDWSFDFSYSYFDFNIKRDLPGFENLLVPNTPEHKLAAGLTYVTEGWNAGLSARWVDDFEWAVGPFVGVVESYTTVDLDGEYAFDDHWSLGVAVSNLLEDNHYEAFGGDILGRRALGTLTYEW